MKKLTKAEKAKIFDKVTTGLLLLLFSMPVLILAYILLWFILK